MSDTLELLVTLLAEDARVPTRAYDDDAGWDLYASESVEIPVGGFVDVPCGIAIAVPEGFFGRITSRSSTFRKRKLDVREGVLDAGYRGPLFAGVHNESRANQVIEKGERVAQLLIHEVPATTWVVVDQLPESNRGVSGFGSSGT